MKILCLGSNAKHTDTQTCKLASDQDVDCHWLLSELECVIIIKINPTSTYLQ